VWQVVPAPSGALILGFIKLQQVDTVEVHLDTLQGGSYKRYAGYTSDFSPADAAKGVWGAI
jgi:hypothetical protein